MNKGIIRVTPEWIAAVLKTDNEVLDVFQSPKDKMTGSYSILLRGEGLPEVPEGDAIPVVEVLR